MNIIKGLLTLGISIGSLFGPKQKIETIELTNDSPVAIEEVVEEKEYEEQEILKEKEPDELQQLYNNLHFDMTYEEIIATIEATGLPYRIKDYNHSKAIKIAFDEEVIPHEYAKEGDYVKLHFTDIIQDNRYEVYVFDEISYWNNEIFESESKINESSEKKELALNPPTEIEKEEQTNKESSNEWTNNDNTTTNETTGEYFSSNVKCEVCEKSGTELEKWYDSNNVLHYTCLTKCTDGLDVLYGPMARDKETVEENDDDNTTDDEIVYWTRGKSYHKSSSCYHYVNAKYHYSGSKSECPKYDPCDDCCY